jgi:dTDP-4-dehydrorhamnose 3,5-epimerase
MDVKVLPCYVAPADDRGSLVEILRDDWDLLPTAHIRQVYLVTDPVRGTIRAFHRHRVLVDWFCIISGAARFILWEEDHSFDYQEIILSARQPKVIEVPPLVYHGWQSLEDNTVLLSLASEVYNREKPDEERKPWDFLGTEVWKTHFR